LSSGELLELLRGLEVARHRAACADHTVVAEIDQRGVAGERACRDTVTLLALLLRVDPREASARVAAARELGPRRALSGEALPPIFATTADAIADAAISAQAARIVTATVEALPDDVRATRDLEIESYLVEQARRFAPRDLRVIARRLIDTYDQDGRLASDADRERRRDMTMHHHADGTVSGRYRTDAVCGEAILTFFDATARPVTGPNGEPDPRNAGQRRHDALRDGLLAVLRSGQLPATGGVTATIVLTMTPDQLDAHQDAHRSGCGLVPTGHGSLMSPGAAQSLLGDAQLHPVLLGSLKRVDAYGDTHRIFTAGQRLTLIARDHGRSFPGCTVGPAWCQAHHVVPYALGGKTSVDDGALLCGYHHRYFEQLGYRCDMRGGVPCWVAPSWIDQAQTPVRNTAHLPQPEPL
jgi:uncharacterized protein DUF222